MRWGHCFQTVWRVTQILSLPGHGRYSRPALHKNSIWPPSQLVVVLPLLSLYRFTLAFANETIVLTPPPPHYSVHMCSTFLWVLLILSSRSSGVWNLLLVFQYGTNAINFFHWLLTRMMWWVDRRLVLLLAGSKVAEVKDVKVDVGIEWELRRRRTRVSHWSVEQEPPRFEGGTMNSQDSLI